MRAFIALALLLAGTGNAETVVVMADRMVDVIAGGIVAHPRITITDGRIVAVGASDAADSTVPPGARRIDLPGMTLLPGLIDMHTHLTVDPRYQGYSGLDFTDNF
jgi:imidazolonepropionase-like amidohydrolase